jgi:hypothetical protein
VYVAWNVALAPDDASEPSWLTSLLIVPDAVVVVVVEPFAWGDDVVVVVGAALGLLEPHADSTMPKPSSASATAVLRR